MKKDYLNLVLATVCFLNVATQCFLALTSQLHLGTAAGYTVALIACGIIEQKNEQLKMQSSFIDDVMQQIRAL